MNPLPRIPSTPTHHQADPNHHRPVVTDLKGANTRVPQFSTPRDLDDIFLGPEIEAKARDLKHERDSRINNIKYGSPTSSLPSSPSSPMSPTTTSFTPPLWQPSQSPPSTGSSPSQSFDGLLSDLTQCSQSLLQQPNDPSSMDRVLSQFNQQCSDPYQPYYLGLNIVAHSWLHEAVIWLRYIPIDFVVINRQFSLHWILTMSQENVTVVAYQDLFSKINAEPITFDVDINLINWKLIEDAFSSGRTKINPMDNIMGCLHDLKHKRVLYVFDNVLEQIGNDASGKKKFDDESRKLYYDDHPGSKEWEELKTRHIPSKDLLQLVKIYAYIEYGITDIKFHQTNGSGNSTRRIYTSRKHPPSYWFVGFKLINKEYYVLDEHVHFESNKQMRLVKHTITDSCIVANHPEFYEDCVNVLRHLSIEALTNVTGENIQIIKKSFTAGDKHKVQQEAKTWSRCVHVVARHLATKKTKELYAELPAKLTNLIDNNPKLTVALQADSEGRFHRLFLGYPVAQHFGDITVPIYIADAFHYKTSSYDGICFNLCTKSSFGDTIILALAIVPSENTTELSWIMQMLIRHGLDFSYPLFTDQGPMLATSAVLLHKLNIPMNIHLCVIHFVRSIKSMFPSIVEDRNIIKACIQEASRACTMVDYFSAVSKMVIQVIEAMGVTVVVAAIDAGIFALRTDPLLWTVFANTPFFVKGEYDLGCKVLAKELYWCKFVFTNMGSVSGVSHDDQDNILFRLIEGGNEFARSQSEGFDTPVKNITTSPGPSAKFCNHTTNPSEGVAIAAVRIGARECIPPASIFKFNEMMNITITKTTKNLITNKDTHDGLSTIGQRLKVGQSCHSLPQRMTTWSVRSISDPNECDGNEIKELIAVFEIGDKSWNTTLTFRHANAPHYRAACQRCVVLTTQSSAPCTCCFQLFESSKKGNIDGFPQFARELNGSVREFEKESYHPCLQSSKRQYESFVTGGNIIMPPSTEGSKFKHMRFNPLSKDGQPVNDIFNPLLPPVKTKNRFRVDKYRIRSLGETSASTARSPTKKKKKNKEGGKYFNDDSRNFAPKRADDLTNRILSSDASDREGAYTIKSVNELESIKKRKIAQCTECRSPYHKIDRCAMCLSLGGGVVPLPLLKPGPYYLYHTPNKIAPLYSHLGGLEAVPVELYALSDKRSDTLIDALSISHRLNERSGEYIKVTKKKSRKRKIKPKPKKIRETCEVRMTKFARLPNYAGLRVEEMRTQILQMGFMDGDKQKLHGWKKVDLMKTLRPILKKLDEEGNLRCHVKEEIVPDQHISPVAALHNNVLVETKEPFVNQFQTAVKSDNSFVSSGFFKPGHREMVRRLSILMPVNVQEAAKEYISLCDVSNTGLDSRQPLSQLSIFPSNLLPDVPDIENIDNWQSSQTVRYILSQDSDGKDDEVGDEMIMSAENYYCLDEFDPEPKLMTQVRSVHCEHF